MFGPLPSRRQFLTAASGLLVVLLARVGRAAGAVRVPIELQVKLLGKVAGYDRKMKSRAGSEVQVLVVYRDGNATSERTSGKMRRELRGLDEIAGLPFRVHLHDYEGPEPLREAIHEHGAAIAYFAPGFSQERTRIADALAGADVLSVASVATDVPGLVLGFDLVSSKAKMLLDLRQARRQNVSFSSKVLKLMKVYR